MFIIKKLVFLPRFLILKQNPSGPKKTVRERMKSQFLLIIQILL